MSTTANRILLFIIGLASLCLTTTTNHLFAILLRWAAPDFLWVADATIPSLLASLGLYLAIRPHRPFALPAPSTSWPPIIRLSIRYLPSGLVFWFSSHTSGEAGSPAPMGRHRLLGSW